MNDLQQIWQDDNEPGKGIPDELLLAYLEGRLKGEELRKVELLLAAEGLESDAVEGLQALPATDAREITSRLNKQLQQTLNKKKKRRRRDMPDQKWSWLAILIILGLALACYAVIYLMKK